MREMAKKAIPLLAALAITVALAVPLIQITVQQLGAGYRDVLAPCSKAWVNHVFKIEDLKILLDGVKIKFDEDLPAGAYIRVELRDNSDNVLAAGEKTLASDLPAGTWVFVDTSPDLGIYDIIKYDRIVVVVAGAEVST